VLVAEHKANAEDKVIKLIFFILFPKILAS
jgi:hypothetical protein